MEMVADRCMQTLTYLQAKDEAKYLAVKDEVEDLVSAVRRIERLLKDRGNDKEVVDRMGIIRSAVNEVEDDLEIWGVLVESAYMYEKNEKKRCVSRLFKRWFTEEEDHSRFIKDTMQDFALRMKEQLILVNSSVVNIFPEEVQETRPGLVMEQRILPWPRQMHGHGMEEHFVGRKKDLRKLISLVTDSSNERKVVIIWGVEGLGKTSLARKVYIHPEVNHWFEALAWISVTQDYEMGSLLQNILIQLGAGTVRMSAEEQPKNREDNMMDELKKMLRQNECFIVVDGVSQLDQWTEISSAILVEETNTKILVTTNAVEMASVGYLYPLSFLNVDKGLKLLQKYAFPGKKPPELGLTRALGKEIVQKCGGRPSAISSIGRRLSNMPLEEWHKVNDDVQGYLQRDNQNQSNEISNEVSDPSYDNLSYCLKQCFLYLAMFKDANPDDLSFLWWAEGMVTPQQQQRTIMDAADCYIRELHLRGMLQMEEDDLSANRRCKRIYLHNCARELSLYKGEREAFLLEIVDFSDGNQPSFDYFSLFDRGIRRFVVHFNKLSSPEEHYLFGTKDLRSIFFLNSSQECVKLPFRIYNFRRFELLRVLHFVRCKFEDKKLPDGIDKLFNLRYLGVLYCDLERLPPSISNVRNLSVLNVRACDDSRIIIPNVIAQMVRLKHLRLPINLNHEQSEKLKLDRLEDLETLDGFNADIHDVYSLYKLHNLRHLGIYARSNHGLLSIIEFVKSHGAGIQTDILVEHKCDFTSAEGSTVLEELLICPNLNALTFSMALINKFPNCGTLASKGVTQIKLIGSKVSPDPMEALGKFPNLRKLCLDYGALEEIKIGTAGFPELEHLEFHCLWNLKKWSVDEGAMKKLSTLIVRNCFRLKQIPQELKNVKNIIVYPRPDAITEASETDCRRPKFGL